jgi:putative ATP-dependent endonuclease of the OLD family
MYLSKLVINNFRGIKELSLDFNEKLNILIAENGKFKTTIIDAIRLLYNLGNQKRDIFIKNEDFHIDSDDGTQAETLSIYYEFKGLSDIEKGALYEYLVVTPGEQYATITISYGRRHDRFPRFEYFTGANPGQRAESGTFEIFQHYYLDALRDATSDLLNARNNVLGKVIKRCIDRKNTESNYSAIIETANKELLKQDEVKDSKKNINKTLANIHENASQIDLKIEQTKIDSIVNLIKPFLPFGASTDGLTIGQNSLGFNNLIYIATVLSDMADRLNTDDVIHFAMLIEEPEAHLHPQLQLNLYNFLKLASLSINCQLFITTHSPTVTSKADIDNLILIENNGAKRIGACFKERVSESLRKNEELLIDANYQNYKKMLQRYLDVTKSQLFYAKSILLVEGISEELLCSAFAQVSGFRLESRDIELVQSGTSFYPFLLLFNSKNAERKLDKKAVVVTDDDRYTDSKDSKYAFSKLTLDNYTLLDELHDKIQHGSPCSRINNLESFRNNSERIWICVGYKTLEYELALANIAVEKERFNYSVLVQYLRCIEPDKLSSIDKYLGSISSTTLDDEYRRKVAILIWKMMPSKAIFAQGFSAYILDNLEAAKNTFVIPPYIVAAFNYLK